MSWTQVHVAGLSPLTTRESFDESVVNLLEDDATTWAGPGTTIVKQTTTKDKCYCFVAFHTLTGALVAVERINGYTGDDVQLMNLQAALSQKAAKKKKGSSAPSASSNLADVRMRRKRAPPAPKHPVVKSSAAPKKKG